MRLKKMPENKPKIFVQTAENSRVSSIVSSAEVPSLNAHHPAMTVQLSREQLNQALVMNGRFSDLYARRNSGRIRQQSSESAVA